MGSQSVPDDKQLQRAHDDNLLQRASDNQCCVLLGLTVLNVAIFLLGKFVCRKFKVSKWLIGGLIIPSIVVGMIFLYGNYRCTRSHIQDPLEIPLTRHVPWFDGWSYSHLLVAFLAGKFINSRKGVALVFIIMLLWEVFEFYLGKMKPTWMKNIGGGSCRISTDKEDKDKVWWYGKYSDILVNSVGLLLSQII
jgi:hypothetical protein